MRCWQYTDSAAAMAIVSGDSGSWRTKHLRRRARYVRWRVVKGDIVMRHLPGAEMVADLGTKALSAAKLRELKDLLGMMLEDGDYFRVLTAAMDDQRGDERDCAEAEPETDRAQRPGGGDGGLDVDAIHDATHDDALHAEAEPDTDWTQAPGGGGLGLETLPDGDRLKLAVLLALIARARSEGGDNDDEETGWFIVLLALYTVLVALCTLGGQRLLSRCGTVRGAAETEMTPGPEATRGRSRMVAGPIKQMRTCGTQTDGGRTSSEARGSDEDYDVVYTSKVGDCFHISPQCTGLNRAQARACRLCSICRPSRSMKKIYGRGFGGEMHSGSHVPCSRNGDGGFLKGFRACKVCLG